MLVAVFYLVLVFGCATSSSSDRPSDFANISPSALSFFQISIGMYPAENFHSLKNSRWVMVMCVGFIVLAPWMQDNYGVKLGQRTYQPCEFSLAFVSAIEMRHDFKPFALLHSHPAPSRSRLRLSYSSPMS